MIKKALIPVRVFLIFIILAFIPLFICAGLTNNDSIYYSLQICFYLLACFLTYLFAKRKFDVHISFQLPKRSLLIIFILIACAASIIINNILSYIWVFGFKSTNKSSDIYLSNTQLGYIILRIESLVIGPIVEELVFRKYCIDAAKGKLNAAAVIIITSLLFAVCHFDSLIHICSAFFFGLVLGYMYLLTNNIIYTICANAATNLMLVLFDYLDSRRVPIGTFPNGYPVYNSVIFITSILC